MIVRLMGEGQYSIDDDALERLNAFDDEATAALEAGDETALERHLTSMWELVRTGGTPLPDNDLSPSEAIVPPLDLSLEETRRLLGDEGFIPDLPSGRP